MADSTQTIGIMSVLLGTGATGVRTLFKRYDYEFPVWIETSLGIAALVLFSTAAILLWSTFLTFIGITLPMDTAWPGTVLYGSISAAVIFGAGYLPAKIAHSADKKTTWDRPILERVIENLDYYRDPDTTRCKVRVITTEPGRSVAEIFVKFLRKFEWEVEVNHEEGTYLYPAKETFRGVILRYRENSYNIARPISAALADIVEPPHTIYFPATDAFDFVQVEIGDIPEDYCGWN